MSPPPIHSSRQTSMMTHYSRLERLMLTLLGIVIILTHLVNLVYAPRLSSAMLESVE